ncbi:MAG: PAS domain S-box protein [Candidatus Heimdallarchaeota archaeon]|nr:PAS domain S-box protein [Candidatus Heimdallarchaeota archaeon]
MEKNKDEKMFIRLVEHASAYSRITLIANLLNSSILVYILRNSVPHSRLITWFVILIVIVIPRAIHAHYAQFPTYSQAKKIEHIYLWGLTLTGIIWGMIPLFVFPEHSLTHAIFVAFVIGGMVVGASMSTASLSKSFLAFSIPSMGPLIIRFFTIGTEITYFMGLMLIIFFFSLAIISKKLHLLIVQTIESNLGKEEEIKVREKIENELRKHQANLELIVEERTKTLSKNNKLLANEVAERKQVEEALRNEKGFTATALDAQQDTFFLFDSATRKAIRWNRSFSDISGYTDEEISRLPAPDSYYSPEDLNRAVIFIGEVLKTGMSSIELELICKDGRKIPFEYNIAVIKDETDGQKYIISIGRDITERKQAEQVLEKHQEHLEEMVDERTDKLRQTINLMAGRENRMAELKIVIEKLRKQLEEAGMTPVANDPLKEGLSSG